MGIHVHKRTERGSCCGQLLCFLALIPIITVCASVDATGSDASCAPGYIKDGVPEITTESVAFLAASGVEIKPLEVLGAEVFGMDLRTTPRDSELLPVLQKEMAARGYIVFRGQGVLSGDEQVRASELFGGRAMHSTHGVHPQAPNEHIFRLSNDHQHGINGVGPQWHNDGSFVRAVFSHVGYHIVRVPENGGATSFAHQGAAFDALTPEEQEVWQRRVSINSNSGYVHPLVHTHPISGKKSVWLHLGMTGAVLEMKEGVTQVSNHEQDLRLLDGREMAALFNRYNDLLNNPAYSAEHHYTEGDCIFIDNLAVAHRATEQAHACATKQGLRILHRTTVKGSTNFDAAPEFGLPAEIYIHGKSPYGQGIFQGGGTGFRWDSNARLQN
mmetsp:Transcript_104978/g.169092  ORF Transcript_104978/g.169092 Transcript_104978/m.169092 type:complete len:386 (+) Transcript_104978:2-1159(+)